jgi:hypothetical protein
VNWEQLRAILWLRWRLTRNQFARGGKVNAVLSVLGSAMMGLLAVGLGVGGVVGGYFAGRNASPEVLLIIWDAVIFAFLMIWVSGLLVEIQRSESIDLTKLLHLPVTLQQVFVFNYVVSHFTPTLILFLPAMSGLCAGLALGSGPAMVLLAPVVLSFIFLTTAWTYCLRGWLAALMVNKRRRRAIIVWVTLVIVLIGQTPNLVFNSRLFRHSSTNRRVEGANGKHSRESAATKAIGSGLPEAFVEGHLALPPGWVGYSAARIRNHDLLPALGLTAASCLIGALGLLRAYRQSLRFYLADERSKEPSPMDSRSRRGPAGRLLVERQLPLLPDDTAALALATLRSLLRAPELKMAAVLPIVIGAMLMSVRFTSKTTLPKSLPAFAATGVAILAAFSLGTTMSNLFGLDRNGFRALVLLPTPRHHILLAKNLAFFPFTITIALLLLGALKVLLHISWGSFLAGVLQVAGAFLLFCMMGNFASILAPYRLAQGTLRARKPKAIVFLAVMISFIILPVLSVPLMIPATLELLFSLHGWVPWLPVNLLVTVAMLAAIGCLYWSLLPFQGRLLQRREQTILCEVTEDTE